MAEAIGYTGIEVLSNDESTLSPGEIQSLMAYWEMIIHQKDSFVAVQRTAVRRFYHFDKTDKLISKRVFMNLGVLIASG